MNGVAVQKRVVIISRVKRNPYVSLLCAALCQPGLNMRPTIVDQFSLGWMWQHRGQVDVLHIHWLELLFLRPTLWRSLKRWVSVMLGLALARLLGVCVVYTVHNIQQHEEQQARLVGLGNRVIFALAGAVHVHDGQTAEVLRRCWGRKRGIHVIPHGNYVTAYRNDCSRAEARRHLGLAEGAFIYLFLGRVRPYKGVEELIAAFRVLDDPGAVLLVAGEVHDPGDEQRLRELAGGDERVHLRLEFVGDDEVQIYSNASDICVLPYRHVTTSGAAILSFSFGVPILAPRMGCFVDLVGEVGERGVLYDPAAKNGLADALRGARRRDLGAMRAACAEYARRFDWNDIARQHAAMYEQCALDKF